MAGTSAEPPCARCVECLQWKPLEAFHQDRSQVNGRNRRCKECRNARNREHVARNRERRAETMTRWRRDNPERYLAAQRACKLRSYGLTAEAYDQLFAAQDGRCAICGDAERDGWDLAVDHDHASGCVRGLLCRKCNVGIGLLRDDARVVSAAAAYLLRSQPECEPRS